MLRRLNSSEQRYRKTAGAVGLSLLFFLFFVYVRVFLLEVSADIVGSYASSKAEYMVTMGLLDAATYLLIFMLPALVVKKQLKKAGYPYQTMHSEPRLTRYLPLVVVAAVFVVHASSYLNNSLITFFQEQEAGASNSVQNLMAMEGYEIALELLSLCVIPGFCEEFLFRGVFLTNFLPFGRTNAILVSSILFALMHENPAQMLYTFVAGVLLGVIYVKTGSIWSCIVVHLINNFVSLFESVLWYNFSQNAAWAIPVWDIVIYALGAISLAVLIFVFFSKSTKDRDGFYQKALPMSDSFATCPIEPRRAVRLLCTPTMIIFFLATGLSIISIWFFGGVLW